MMVQLTKLVRREDLSTPFRWPASFPAALSVNEKMPRFSINVPVKMVNERDALGPEIAWKTGLSL
jgi:hypothetical protein